MTDNIINFKHYTENDPADMLKAIAEEDPNDFFAIVFPKDGSIPTYHSSTGDMPVVLMRLQEFIHKYYNGDFSDCE